MSNEKQEVRADRGRSVRFKRRLSRSSRVSRMPLRRSFLRTGHHAACSLAAGKSVAGHRTQGRRMDYD